MPYFRNKMLQIRLRPGSTPDTAGELTALPETLLLGFYFLVQGGEEKGNGKGGEGSRGIKGKGERGRKKGNWTEGRKERNSTLPLS